MKFLYAAIGAAAILGQEPSGAPGPAQPPGIQPPVTPVASLDEVSAGTVYDEDQPPVESPTLLRGRRVALVVAPGSAEVEVTFPYKYLRARGADVDVVAPAWAEGRVLLSRFLRPSVWIRSDRTLAEARRQVYDVVIVSGGAWADQILKEDVDALALLTSQYQAGRWVAGFCSGVGLLANYGLARGAEMVAPPPVVRDVQNAGALVLDKATHVSGSIITGRDPTVLTEFMTVLRDALLSRPCGKGQGACVGQGPALP